MPKQACAAAKGITANADAPLSTEAINYLANARDELKSKLQALKQTWRFDEQERWGFDQLTGDFRLEFGDRKEFHADGQILGSYSESGGTWEWAWHNPYVAPPIARDSQLVKETCERLGFTIASPGVVSVPHEQVVEDLCALGLKASDSIGVFRGLAGPVEVMILLKNPRVVEKAAKVSRKKAA